MRRRSGSTSPLMIVLAPLALVAAVAACDSEEPECTKNEECQEITCPDGSKMRTCQGGVCLQGDDCETESSGGW